MKIKLFTSVCWGVGGTCPPQIPSRLARSAARLIRFSIYSTNVTDRNHYAKKHQGQYLHEL